MSLIDHLEYSKRDAVVNKCKKDGCSLKIDLQTDSVLILDCDKLPACDFVGKKPDYIILANLSQIILLVVEFKSGRVNDISFIDQLRAGADYANNLFAALELKILVPVVVYGSMDPFATRKLKSVAAQIKFAGARFFVSIGKCGVLSLSHLVR